MEGRKVIYDPLHGGITVDDVFLSLVDRHEVQRLRSIRQLGLSNIVFPGANHTRFEHSLGVYHLAGRMSDAIGLNKCDSDTVKAAAMLHDICHAPFSHTLENIMSESIGFDHMELSRMLINGEVPTFMERDSDFYDGKETIAEVLEQSGISADRVCDLIINPQSDIGALDIFTAGPDNQSFFHSNDYQHQIIHGPVDADQMDYLVRDSHYTGVNHGAIDTERILGQLKVHNNKIVLMKGGITAAEGLMVSRSLMYSTVYYHRTVKIVEAMLRRAVELSNIDLTELYLMSDHDLISGLYNSGGKPADLVRSVFSRKLYKVAYAIDSVNADDDIRAELNKYTSKSARTQLEYDIATLAGTNPEEIIVDIPSSSTLLSKVKIGKTDVTILDNDKARSITKYSTLAKAMQARGVIDWVIMVSAPESCIDAVRSATSKILSFDYANRN